MNLLRALVTVSGMTLLSRILGFVRDFVIARTFGAGLATDAFFVAFKLPNLLRRMFAEGAFSQAFVPILGEYKNKRGDQETLLLIDHVTSILALVLFAVTAIGVAAAPLLVWISAPGFAADADKFELTVQLTRITFPYIFFMSLVALAGGILNTMSRFALPAFTPVLLNVAFIGMALFAVPYFDPPVLALGWAVFLGGVLQLAIQIPALRRIAMLPRPSLNWRAAWAGSRRAPHPDADGPGAARRLGVADQPADQHHLRLVPQDRQRFLALLRRPPDGVSLRHARRRARHHPAAFALEVSRQRQPSRVFETARLGLAPDPAARRAGRACPRRARGAADRHAVPSRRVHR